MGPWRPRELWLGRGGAVLELRPPACPSRAPPGTQPGPSPSPPAEPPRAWLRAGAPPPRPGPKKAQDAAGWLRVYQAWPLRSARRCCVLRRGRLGIPIKVVGGEASGPAAACGDGGSPPCTLGGRWRWENPPGRRELLQDAVCAALASRPCPRCTFHALKAVCLRLLQT